MRKFSRFLVIIFSLVLLGQGCAIGPGSGGNENQTSGPAGMFVTTDKGETWEQISTFPRPDGVQSLNQVSAYDLFADPQDPNALYWASRSNGLFYSYNSGKSWQKSTGPVSSGFIYSVAVHPDDKCLIFATNGSRVFRSDDCSRSWEEVHREDRGSASISSLAFSPTAPYELYMSKENGEFLVSPDTGSSWTVLNRFNRVNIEEILTDKQESGVLYLATQSSGLYRSTDRGRNWDNLRESMNDYPGALEYRRSMVHPGNAGQIYWASKYGILVSRDQGETWAPLDLITSPGSANIWGIAVNPKDDSEIYYTATINNRSTFYFTTDGGETWTTRELPTDRVPTVLEVHPERTNVLYAGFTIPPSN